LIQPVAGENVYSDFVKQHGYGVHHISLLVDDMESALAEARTAGFEMTMDGAGFGADGDGHYPYLLYSLSLSDRAGHFPRRASLMIILSRDRSATILSNPPFSYSSSLSR
jgi:hypothetical protein